MTWFQTDIVDEAGWGVPCCMGASGLMGRMGNFEWRVSNFEWENLTVDNA